MLNFRDRSLRVISTVLERPYVVFEYRTTSNSNLNASEFSPKQKKKRKKTSDKYDMKNEFKFQVIRVFHMTRTK